MRSFDIVDEKVLETDFFLSRGRRCTYNFFAFRYYVSAFVSSCRSITFALQSSLSDEQRFRKWYADIRDGLRNDPLARFFHRFRTVSQHIGDNPVSGGVAKSKKTMMYYFLPTADLPQVPAEDVVSCCYKYLTRLVDIVFECYVSMGDLVDPQQYFSSENFMKLGKTVEDAEEELGFPRGWTDIGDPAAIECRWQALRQAAGKSQLDKVFLKYLRKSVPRSVRLPDYKR